MATKHYDGWQPDVRKRTRTYSGTHGTHSLQDFHYVMECFVLPGPPGSLPDKHFSHFDAGSLTAFLPIPNDSRREILRRNRLSRRVGSRIVVGRPGGGCFIFISGYKFKLHVRNPGRPKVPLAATTGSFCTESPCYPTFVMICLSFTFHVVVLCSFDFEI